MRWLPGSWTAPLNQYTKQLGTILLLWLSFVGGLLTESVWNWSDCKRDKVGFFLTLRKLSGLRWCSPNSSGKSARWNSLFPKVVHNVLKTDLHTWGLKGVRYDTNWRKKKKQFQGEPWKSRYGILMSALGIDRILILQRTDNWVSMIH